MITHKVAVVQCYIHHVTGKEVNIKTPTDADNMNLLYKAYDIARTYLK